MRLLLALPADEHRDARYRIAIRPWERPGREVEREGRFTDPVITCAVPVPHPEPWSPDAPNLYRVEFLSSHYRRLIAFLRSHGVDLILVDTDGNFEALIPEFLDVGVDGFCPMEVAAGMDPVIMRRRYGTAFSMIGGIDKREVAFPASLSSPHIIVTTPAGQLHEIGALVVSAQAAREGWRVTYLGSNDLYKNGFLLSHCFY